jgi:hypothetical protein
MFAGEPRGDVTITRCDDILGMLPCTHHHGAPALGRKRPDNRPLGFRAAGHRSNRTGSELLNQIKDRAAGLARVPRVGGLPEMRLAFGGMIRTGVG